MTAPSLPPAERGGGLRAALRVRFLGVVAFLVLIWLVFAVLAPRFRSVDNAQIIFFSAAILVIAACSGSLVVITGNLDLSVGAVMGMAAYITADVTANLGTDAGPWIVLLAVGIGAVLGLVNGVLVAYLELPSIVVTLGTMSLYRGATFVYAGGQQVTSSQLPRWMIRTAEGSFLGIPYLVWIAAAVVALVAWVLRSTAAGRMLYAYGSNKEAARFFGLPSIRIVVGAYVGAGVLAGLAGFLYAARVGTVTVVLANGWELQVLAAVVIGGVSIWGGSGSVIGAALGAVALASIDNGLVLLNVQEYWRLVIQGVAIVLAVAVGGLVASRGRVQRRRLVAVSAL